MGTILMNTNPKLKVRNIIYVEPELFYKKEVSKYVRSVIIKQNVMEDIYLCIQNKK